MNQSNVVEVKQCSPWCDHPTVGMWYEATCINPVCLLYSTMCVYPLQIVAWLHGSLFVVPPPLSTERFERTLQGGKEITDRHAGYGEWA